MIKEDTELVYWFASKS